MRLSSCYIVIGLAFLATLGLFNPASARLRDSSCSGVALWTQMEGTPGSDVGTAIATDSSGNVFVAGYTYGNLNGKTNQDPSGSTSDIFLIKFDGSGDPLWTVLDGTKEDDEALGVAADSAGNAYITGYVSGSMNGEPFAGGTDIFLSKYDPNGNRLWTVTEGTSNNDQGNAIAVDASGNIFVAGFASGSLGGAAYVAEEDIFVSKFAPDGNLLWTAMEGTNGQDAAYGVTTDAQGNVWVTGATAGSLDGLPYSGGISDIFLLKYNSSGQRQLVREDGTGETDTAQAVASDAAGNVYIAGETQGALDGQINQGNLDIFLSKYSGSGVLLWTKMDGTTANDAALGVALDGSGGVYITGYTYGNLEGETNAGFDDAFVSKYDTNGVWTWTRLEGSASQDQGLAIASDPSGDVFVTGFSFGSLGGGVNAGSQDIFVSEICTSASVSTATPTPSPTATPTNTKAGSTASPTPTGGAGTATPTPAVSPTATGTSGGPTNTPAASGSPTPSPTSGSSPRILFAGYWNTDITAANGGVLQMVAFGTVPGGGTISQMTVYYQNAATGVTLPANPFVANMYWLSGIEIPAPGAAFSLTLELEAETSGGGVSDLWPNLTVGQ